MTNRRATVAAMALLVFPWGTEARGQTPSSPPAGTSAKAVRESLLKADRALSAAVLKKGMSVALGEVMAPDALFLYEGVPVISGRASILTLLEAQPVLTESRVQWLPLVVAVSSDGSLGATWGAMSVKAVTSQADSAARFGKYISTWRRLTAGVWQLAAYVEMGLSDQKAVIPANLPLSPPSFGDPLSGSGGAFAKADADFARMATVKGAPAAFGAFAAPDAITLPGTGEIIVGPRAITARMLESSAATAKWEWHPVYAEGSVSGDLGFTVGEATIAVSGSNGVTEFHSKYLTVWRRQDDGSIRFIVDGGNGR